MADLLARPHERADAHEKEAREWAAGPITYDFGDDDPEVLASRARAGRVALAREDVDEFCAFVGKDAETGQGISQEEIHEDFQHFVETHNRAIVMSHPEAGKTTQLAILRTLWRLGRNPNLRVVICSKIESKCQDIVRAIRSYIEKSPEVAEVFPNLLPGDKWGEDKFTIRRDVHGRDPSVSAIPLDGSPGGSRIDILILDDILDAANTATPQTRKAVIKRVRSAFLDRLSQTGEVIFLTNAWHPEDAAHLFEKEGWATIRKPVVNEDGESTWPTKWTPTRIKELREDLGPLEFARAALCKARDDGESPFDVDAIQAAEESASDLEFVHRLQAGDLPAGAMIYHGVDLAVTKTAGSHYTVFATILYWPEDGTRQVIWIESGRWSSREIRDRFIDHQNRYGGIFIVENNAAQRWIIDIVENQSDLAPEERVTFAIVPFTTGKNKAHPEFGVEGLAVEIAAKKWLFPVHGPAKVVKDWEELRGEMVYYTRGGHTGDRLMSLWFAREGARKGSKAGKGDRPEAERDHDYQGGGVRVIGERPESTTLADVFVD